MLNEKILMYFLCKQQAFKNWHSYFLCGCWLQEHPSALTGTLQRVCLPLPGMYRVLLIFLIAQCWSVPVLSYAIYYLQPTIISYIFTINSMALLRSLIVRLGSSIDLSRRGKRRTAHHQVCTQSLPRDCPLSLRPTPLMVQDTLISKRYRSLGLYQLWSMHP